MNRQELIALLFDNMNNVTTLQGTYNMLVALVCAVIVYTVYYITSKEVRPTVSFAVTILIVTLSTSLILMLIGSNLALSLGMVGALSIIRFRAAVKDTRDASFIFYAIAVGMTSALGIYTLSFAGVLLIGAAIVIFSFFNIGSRTYILTIITNASNPLVEEEIKKTTRNHYDVIAMSSRYGDENTLVMETVYEIGIKKGAASLNESLLQIDGVKAVNAVLREDT